jgi:dihydrofolate synthase/folylpolyglutamate synthase
VTHDDYTRALDTLYRSVDTSHRANPELNLQRTRALLAALGAPEQHIRCVIVAGTKGKGSTAAMIERIARAAGMRTGLWTSPHLHTYRERIQVDGQPIAAAQLIADIDAIMPLADAVARATGGMPATFAIGFALALQHFARSGVGLAVIEVGLGGTYDSAAVLEPECAVIASISYDHMEILGDTLDAIARQKAGIMRRGRPAVTVAQLPGALAALIDEAQRIGAPLTLVADPASDRAVPHDLPSTVRVVMPDPLVDAPLGLAGSFQRENAGLALAAVRQLQALGWCIPDAALGAGLAACRWPARFELVPGTPPILIDGAHNGDSLQRLFAALADAFPGAAPVVVFGTSRGKDLPRMLPVLVRHAAAIVLTSSQHHRALAELHDLEAQVRAAAPHGALPVVCVPDPAGALAQARAWPGAALVCVTGSLFLAAAAREVLGLPHDADPA